MLLLKSSPEGSDRSIVPSARKPISYLKARPLHFHCAFGVLNTRILAYMLDSLVRVSRRVKENHFVTITNLRTSFARVTHSSRGSNEIPREIYYLTKITAVNGADWNLNPTSSMTKGYKSTRKCSSSNGFLLQEELIVTLCQRIITPSIYPTTLPRD